VYIGCGRLKNVTDRRSPIVLINGVVAATVSGESGNDGFPAYVSVLMLEISILEPRAPLAEDPAMYFAVIDHIFGCV